MTIGKGLDAARDAIFRKEFVPPRSAEPSERRESKDGRGGGQGPRRPESQVSTASASMVTQRLHRRR